jgi:hypothetical protein
VYRVRPNRGIPDFVTLDERCAGAGVAAEPHHSFGKDLVGETWELAL